MLSAGRSLGTSELGIKCARARPLQHVAPFALPPRLLPMSGFSVHLGLQIRSLVQLARMQAWRLARQAEALVASTPPSTKGICRPPWLVRAGC